MSAQFIDYKAMFGLVQLIKYIRLSITLEYST